MAKPITAFLFLVFVFISSSFSAEEMADSYRIYIENKTGGQIMVGDKVVGKVLVPVSSVNEGGYTASEWVSAGEIAATAVNAIHIKTKDKRSIFSLLPKKFLKNPKHYNSYLNKASSLYTDLKINTSIFGGGFSPCVGNKVLVNGKTMEAGYVPRTGDQFMVLVERPRQYPTELVFENKYQGKVYLQYKDGSRKVVAFVFRPVAGVGRFAGTRYLNPGRIRANHAGVIDISTSVEGGVGGFQIIPASHAQSPEMRAVKYMNQWMVVGPSDLFGKSLEGAAPLFRYYLKPQYNEDDIFADDWEARLLGHFLVEVNIGGRWQPVPIFSMYPGEDLPAEANTFLKDVLEIRILFPQ